MKNQRGFIQIPLLIAIIATILVVGGGGYFGFQKYKSVRIEQAKERKIAEEEERARLERERRAQELIIGQQKALEDTKQEIKKLENQNSQPNTIVNKSSASLTPLEISRKFGKYVVQVHCEERDRDGGAISWADGSGIIIGKNPNSGNFIIMTNRHVVPGVIYSDPVVMNILERRGIPDSGRIYPCAISHGLEPTKIFTSSYATGPTTYRVLPEYLSSDLDVYFLETGPRLNLGDADSLSQITIQPMLCRENEASTLVGEQVLILGYPTISGGLLTLTEGLISSFEDRTWQPIKKKFYVTSAKIEHGNSGGAAFLIKSGCLIGMPAFASVGEIESLSRLIDLPWIGKQYSLFDTTLYLK